MSDWLVEVYNKDDKVFDAWLVEDRTEREAQGEAEGEIQIIGCEAADWTMTKVDWREGGEIKVTFKVEARIRLHPIANHARIEREVRERGDELIEARILEQHIADIVEEHYFSVCGMAEAELDVFMDWLEAKGLDQVSVTVDTC